MAWKDNGWIKGKEEESKGEGEENRSRNKRKKSKAKGRVQGKGKGRGRRDWYRKTVAPLAPDFFGVNFQSNPSPPPPEGGQIVVDTVTDWFLKFSQ